MVTITLPPELEKTITDSAYQQGTTPELLSLQGLHQLFPSTMPSHASEAGGSLADFLGDMVGCINSSEFVNGGAQMSKDTGKQFAEGMALKREAGML